MILHDSCLNKKTEIGNKIITEIENLSLPMLGAIIDFSNNDNGIKKNFDETFVELLVRELSLMFKDEVFHVLPDYTLFVCLELQYKWGYMNTSVIGKAIRILTEKEPVELLDEKDLNSILEQVYARVKQSYKNTLITNKMA